jgi:uncharacterized protein YcsI (UPF0317 family)
MMRIWCNCRIDIKILRLLPTTNKVEAGTVTAHLSRTITSFSPEMTVSTRVEINGRMRGRVGVSMEPFPARQAACTIASSGNPAAGMVTDIHTEVK